MLGEYIDDKIDVTNCYALPFEEDAKDKKVWFVDHVSKCWKCTRR